MNILDDQMQYMSQDELVAYLVSTFLEDYWQFEKYQHPFDFCERICECMERHPEKVSIVKDEKCPHCGGTLIRFYYKKSEGEPEEINFRQHEEDFLVICKECKECKEPPDLIVLYQDEPYDEPYDEPCLYGGPELPYPEIVIDPDNPPCESLYGGPVEFPDDINWP